MLDEEDMGLSSCCSEESFDTMDASSCDDESLFFDTDEEDTDMSSVSSYRLIEKDAQSEGIHSQANDQEDYPIVPVSSTVFASSSPSFVSVLTAETTRRHETLHDIVIHKLNANEQAFTHLELSFPLIETNGCTKNFSALLKAIRCNRTVTKCTVSSDCFQGLNMCQKRALVDAIGGIPHLSCLVLNSSIVDFMSTHDYCRRWKRDQHYHLHRQYCEFQNTSVQTILVTGVPADIVEGFLGHLVMMVVANFASLKQLDVWFTDDIDSLQADLMRVALTALNYSRRLVDVNFAQDDGSFVMEVGASRSAEILKVLKLRCHGEYLSSHSYMAIAHMLRVNSHTLNGLVLETALDKNGTQAIANSFVQCNNLKALCLGTFDCEDTVQRDSLLALVTQVLCPQQQNGSNRPRPSSLEYLSLVCQELDDTGLQEIATALTQSCLRDFVLLLDNEADEAISSKGIAALARVLRDNDTIEHLSLICNTIDDHGIESLAGALKDSNGTLKKLQLQCSKSIKITSAGYDAVLDMLKQNTVIESFDLGSISGLEDEQNIDAGDSESRELDMFQIPHCIRSKMDFFLKLNQSGVRNLQLDINIGPEKFADAVFTQRNELDNLYFMLSVNPSFMPNGTIPMEERVAVAR